MLTYIKLFFIVIHSAISSVFALIFSIIDPSHTLYFWLTKYFSKGIFLLSGIKVEAIGRENFHEKGQYIFVSNHSSLYDIPVLQLKAAWRTSIIFKKELGRIPIFGWQLVTGPHIMVERQRADKAFRSIERAKEAMAKKKMSVLLFPEGTRSKTGEVQPFKRGAFYLAVRSGYPIIPVSISGTNKILPKGSFQIKSGTITVKFGEPISTANISSRKDEIDLMNKVRDIIIQNLS